MVNPYMLSTASRAAPKAQVSLNQSNALKKFEKIQARSSMGSSGNFGKSKNRRNTPSIDSDITMNKETQSGADNSDDDDDEDSVFKNATRNANKFMKKKPTTTSVAPSAKSNRKIADDDDDEVDDESDDLEISISNNKKSAKTKSATSSVSSMIVPPSNGKHKVNHRRSPSKVKFLSDDINEYSSMSEREKKQHNYYDQDQDESSIGEDLLIGSRNLVLDINDLEPAVSSSTNKIRKKSKSPSLIYNGKRSESVASIVEEEEEDYSSLTPSIASPSLLETNLILDINELEKNVNKNEIKKKEAPTNSKKTKKDSPTASSDSESSSKSETESSKTLKSDSTTKKEKLKKKKEKKRLKEKKEKEKKEKEKKKKEKEKKKKEKEKEKKKKEKEKRKKEKEKKSKSSIITTEEISDETSIATEIITEQNLDEEEDEEIRTLKSGDEMTSLASSISRKLSISANDNKTKSYYDDFDETDQDLTQSRRTKQLSFAADSAATSNQTSRAKRFSKKKQAMKADSVMRSVEIQVNPNDLLKNSDLIRSVSVYNPSSLLLASIAQFDQSNLRDLNQITGYNMINQSFNDLLKINLNFFKNFLATQRSLYEFQIQSFSTPKFEN